MKLRMRIQYVPTNREYYRYQVQYRYQWFTDWHTEWLTKEHHTKHLLAAGLSQDEINVRLHFDSTKLSVGAEDHLRCRAYFATQDMAIAFAKSFYDAQLIKDAQEAQDEKTRRQKLAQLGKQRIVWKWP